MNKDSLFEAIQIIKEQYERNQIRDFEFTACYILLYSQCFHGLHWCNGYSPLTALNQGLGLPKCNASRNMKENQMPELDGLRLKDVPGLLIPGRLSDILNSITVIDFISNYSIKHTKQFVREEILHWSRGKRDYELVFHIPDPKDVLKQMIDGRRAITALVQREEMDIVINDAYPPFKNRNTLEFLIHDLQHMREFTGSQKFYQEQVGFFYLCRNFLESSFLDQVGLDSQFLKDLEHALSDMNACSVHLFKFLKAKVIDAENRAVAEGFPVIRENQPTLQIILKWWSVPIGSAVWNSAMNACKSKDESDDVVLQHFFKNGFRLVG